MQTLLKTQNLTKQFSPGKGAVDISLEVEPGEIVGFIGPNGAGKSTTMKMLTGQIAQNSGEFSFFGERITDKSMLKPIWPKISYLPSEDNLYPTYTTNQLISYLAGFYKDRTKAVDRAKSIANELELDVNKKIYTLSFGNKKKAGIVLSLMHSPRLAIWDEPTNGLDPLVQKKVLQLLVDLKEKEGGALLSSHVLSEVQAVCDRVVMIKDAKIIISERTSKLLKSAVKVIKVDTSNKTMISELLKLPGVVKHYQYPEELVLYANSTDEFVNYFAKKKFYQFYIEKPSLEEMFLSYYE